MTARLRSRAAAFLLPRSLLMLMVVLSLGLGLPLAARAQGIELTHLTLQRDAGLLVDFNARVTLPPAVEDALQHGVPMYFVAEANVMRHRWYWRDARVAQAVRSWRLSYQPLSGSWRVSLGGLAQSYSSLEESLTALSSSGRWKIADATQIDPDDHYYVEFSFRLDTSQLPRPMQFGIGGQADWSLGIERQVRVD